MHEKRSEKIEKYKRALKALKLINNIPEKKALRKIADNFDTYQDFVPAEIPLLEELIKNPTEQNKTSEHLQPTSIDSEEDISQFFEKNSFERDSAAETLKFVLLEMSLINYEKIYDDSIPGIKIKYEKLAKELYSFIEDIPENLFFEEFNLVALAILNDLKQSLLFQKAFNMTMAHNKINQQLLKTERAGKFPNEIAITRQKRTIKHLRGENDPESYLIALILIAVGLILLLWRIFLY